MEDNNNDVIYGGDGTEDTNTTTKETNEVKSEETSTTVSNELSNDSVSNESNSVQNQAHNDSWWETVEEPKKTDVCGIISLIVGIICIPLSCCGCIFVAPVFSVAGIVLAIVSKVQRGKFSGLAIAGLILSIVGLLFFALVLCGTVYLEKMLSEHGYTMQDLSNDPEIINEIIEK